MHGGRETVVMSETHHTASFDRWLGLQSFYWSIGQARPEHVRSSLRCFLAGRGVAHHVGHHWQDGETQATAALGGGEIAPSSSWRRGEDTLRGGFQARTIQLARWSVSQEHHSQ